MKLFLIGLLFLSALCATQGFTSLIQKPVPSAKTVACTYYSGELKIPTGDESEVGFCPYIQEGYQLLVEVSSQNPTGDDVYNVNAFLFPNAIEVGENECQVPAESSCNLAYGSPCTPPGPSKNPHLDWFNLTACGNNCALFVLFECLKTPGAFNDHCEINYSIGLCGTVFVNQTGGSTAICQN